jgi:hypothetical protein
MFNFAVVVRGGEIAARGLAHRICSVLLLAHATNRTADRQIRASAPRRPMRVLASRSPASAPHRVGALTTKLPTISAGIARRYYPFGHKAWP